MGMSGYDRVIIEPSGVFDMDEFFDTLSEAPLDRWYEAGSVITVVDALLDEQTSEAEDFFLASQAVSAGCVLISKAQLATEQQIQNTLRHLSRAAQQIQCPAIPESRILCKPWDELTGEDFDRLMHCGYRMSDYVKTVAGRLSEFQSLSYLDLPLTEEELREKIESLFREERYGRILRVKGFFRENGCWYQINATAKEIHVEEVPENRAVITVIGAGLQEKPICILLTGKAPEHRLL
jgi:G3E family GTPase